MIVATYKYDTVVLEISNSIMSRYVTINLGEIYIADNIKEKSFGLDGRLDELLPALREACENDDFGAGSK